MRSSSNPVFSSLSTDAARGATQLGGSGRAAFHQGQYGQGLRASPATPAGLRYVQIPSADETAPRDDGDIVTRTSNLSLRPSDATPFLSANFDWPCRCCSSAASVVYRVSGDVQSQDGLRAVTGLRCPRGLFMGRHLPVLTADPPAHSRRSEGSWHRRRSPMLVVTRPAPSMFVTGSSPPRSWRR